MGIGKDNVIAFKQALAIQDLSYRYPDGTQALNRISFTVPTGARVAILGANGCGKSTLFYHLNGLLMAQEGTIQVFGQEVVKGNLQQIRQRVGFVFANPDSQLFATSVKEDIAFGPRNLQLDEQEIYKRVEWAMKQVCIKELADRPPQNLSLGQKKRVAIAGVLAMNPDILVFDEPTVGLDPSSKRQLFDIINNLEQEGKTIIISTHDVDLAYQWANQVIIMSEGKVLDIGTASVLCNADLVEKAALDMPQMAKIFCGTEYEPRTAEEANVAVRKLIEGNSRPIKASGIVRI